MHLYLQLVRAIQEKLIYTRVSFNFSDSNKISDFFHTDICVLLLLTAIRTLEHCNSQEQ